MNFKVYSVEKFDLNDNEKAIFLSLLAVLSWSTISTALKIALEYITHFEMMLISCLTALIFFTLLLTVTHRWYLVGKLTVRHWVVLAAVGLVNPVAYYWTLFRAYELLPAQVAQPINYAWPIVLLIFLAVFAHEPIQKRKYIGMFLSLIGVVLISLGAKNNSNLSISASGVIFGIMSAVLWASYWMINNMLKDKMDVCVALFVTFLFGTLYLSLGTLFLDFSVSDMKGIIAGVYIGGFEMGIPFILFGVALKKTTNHTLVNQLCYLSPFLSLFFISLVLGEHIIVTTYIGLVLIVSGLLFNQYCVNSNTKLK